MLLVSFHGGKGGIGNLYAYDTSGATATLNTRKALKNAPWSDPELRGMVSANGLLYVVNGARAGSNIECFSMPGKSDGKYRFGYAGEFLGPDLDASKRYKTAIGHPYSILLSPAAKSAAYCYVANQDTNTVAQAVMAKGGKTASIEKGWCSPYLKRLTGICPKGGCVFMDGTFVASQNGTLPDAAIAATNVPAADGGLAVQFATAAQASNAAGKAAKNKNSATPKVQNSVRDLAVWNGVLLVCDEPSRVIRAYTLADGTYLGASLKLAADPTHLTVFNGELFVSAGDQIFWSALGTSVDPAKLSFGSVLTGPAGYKVGGVAFDAKSNTAYVAFQQGTGTTETGSIYSYALGAKVSLPPEFGPGTLIASALEDTPEFLLFVD